MKHDTADIQAACVSTVYVETWAAVVQGVVGEPPRRFGACRDDAIIPAGLRRRLNTYGRMAVSCGLSVALSNQSEVIFCSRYGDMEVASRLLDDLVQGAPMSPAAFSLSVHNAVPAVMDIARKNQVGHTAIAAGSQSLSAGITEAWVKLTSRPKDVVSLVYADCALSGRYEAFADGAFDDIALALTLSTQAGKETNARIALADDGVTKGINLHEPPSEELACLFIEALDGGRRGPLNWQSGGVGWCFSAGSDEAI